MSFGKISEVEAGARRAGRVAPVSYTHLDVYKRQAMYVPAYSTGDARLAWKVRPELEVSVVGQNLFQPSHVEAAGDPVTLVGIVRSGYLKLTWTH